MYLHKNFDRKGTIFLLFKQEFSRFSCDFCAKIARFSYKIVSDIARFSYYSVQNHSLLHIFQYSEHYVTQHKAGGKEIKKFSDY